MSKVIMVTGGSRSGKSVIAEQKAKEYGKRSVLYLATAIPIDDDMKEEITQIYYDDFLDELEMNQIPLELYCKRSGHSEDEIYADKEQEAVEAIQAQSVLHAVAAAEKISITPEELAEELRAIAIEEDEDPEEFVETLEEEDVENIADQLTMDKTMAFILDSVIYDK